MNRRNHHSNKRKKFLLLLVLVGTFSPLLSASASTTDQLQEITQSGILRIGIGESNFPFVFTNSTINETVGFNIDIASYISNQLNTRLVLIKNSPNYLIQGLTNGTYDLVFSSSFSSSTITQQVNFTRWYFQKQGALLVSGNNPKSITNINDLHKSGIKIGTTLNLTNNFFKDNNLNTTSYISYTNISSVFEALQSGSVDVVISDYTSLHANDLKNNNISVAATYSFEKYSFAVKTGENELLAKLNDIIDGLLGSNKNSPAYSTNYISMYSKWFDVPLLHAKSNGNLLSVLQLILLLTLVICLALLVLEKGDKLIVSMAGAGISIAAGALPYWTVDGVPGQTLLPNGINTLLSKIEPDLMFIIIGMTLLVGVTAETGIYELIAIKIIKLSKGNQKKLMLYLSLLSMTFAAFLDAYMAIIIIGTITLVSANILFKESDNQPINPKPFLLAEALFANVGGMLTRVASPPNLILGAHFQISFLEFSIAMFPVVFFSAIGTFLILEFFFRKDLAIKISAESIEQLMSLDESNVIRDPRLLKRAIFIILATIVGFFLSSFAGAIKIELGYIALAGGFSAVALVSGEKPEKTLNHIEWSVVFFYAGLLTMVGLVEQAHLLEPLVKPIESIFDINKYLGLTSIVIFNVVISSVLDNIPMAAIMTGVIDGLKDYLGPSIGSVHPMVWAAVIGTNAGGNVTPIASAAGVQVVEILNRERDKSRHISFFEFFRIGVVVALVPVIIGIAYVILVARLFYGW